MDDDEKWEEIDIHHRGVGLYGTRWLAVNRLIVDLVWQHGGDPSRAPWNTILPMIALRWCADIEEAVQAPQGT